MTRDDLLRAILENPGDDTPRLAYADWLDDNAGVVPCPICTGPGFPRGPFPAGCTKCRGNLEIPDGRRERAEFIRVQCELAVAGFGEVKSDLLLRTDRIGDLARRQRELWRLPIAGTWFGDTCFIAIGRSVFDRTGDQPGGKPSGLIRRGFVSEVRLPLAVFVGGECGTCGGQRVVPRPRPVLAWPGGQMNMNDDCPDCHAPDAAGAVAKELFSAQPVEKISITDIEPDQFDDLLFWADLPPEIASHLPGEPDAGYPQDGMSAADALSAACVAYGRQLAGLPQLEPQGVA